jgi:hypothetical protein
MILIPKKAYELPDVYRFNGPLERDGQNLPFAGLRHLVVRAASARRRASHPKGLANHLDVGDPPAGSRIPGHLVQNVSHPMRLTGLLMRIIQPEGEQLTAIHHVRGIGNPKIAVPPHSRIRRVLAERQLIADRATSTALSS